MDYQEFLLKCVDCGEAFFTDGEKQFYDDKSLTIPKRCKKCREAKKTKSAQLELEKAISESPFSFIEQNDIVINTPDLTLFVIGNGFDRMHGVPSSYYHFRDSLGRRSDLRRNLEFYIKKEDLWADFEDSLAYLDTDSLVDLADDWMDIFDVKEQDDDDFSAADFFLAAENAAGPALTIPTELPKKFRRWVETLQPSSNAKPLSDIIDGECRYINFNYTEFLESLYHVPYDKITYIHGNRRNKKAELVLGHAPDAGSAEFENEATRRKHSSRRMTQTVFDLMETTGNYTAGYFDATEKKTDRIIRDNDAFFKSITNIETIITIGHSLSPVDYPYFKEIMRANKDSATIMWFISWHTVDDLERVQAFSDNMGIAKERIRLFKS